MLCGRILHAQLSSTIGSNLTHSLGILSALYSNFDYRREGTYLNSVNPLKVDVPTVDARSHVFHDYRSISAINKNAEPLDQGFYYFPWLNDHSHVSQTRKCLFVQYIELL